MLTDKLMTGYLVDVRPKLHVGESGYWCDIDRGLTPMLILTLHLRAHFLLGNNVHCRQTAYNREVLNFQLGYVHS
jgi:hypothetical protein